jgi:RNA polymerase sigma-B factor
VQDQAHRGAVRPTQREHRPDSTEVAAWCTQYATTRDPGLRRTIIENHDWLVQVCARQVRRRDEPLDDLLQTGRVALLLALERFDPMYGVTFRTFASATILGELRRHFRSTWKVHVPRRVQERHLAVRTAIEHLTSEQGGSPTPAAIAAWLRVPQEDVVEALAVGLTNWPVPLGDADGVREDVQLSVVDDREVDAIDSRAEIEQLMRVLPERERLVLHLRFFHEQTQTQIAERLGLSQVHVSRIMRNALNTLQHRARLGQGVQASDSEAAGRTPDVVAGSSHSTG